MSKQMLPPLDEIKGVLFDIDGTLLDSDPLHLLAFRNILQERGYNGGEPITEEFFRETISGRHNPEIVKSLFPDMTPEEGAAFAEEKEARFRELAAQHLAPMPGLVEFLEWMDSRGLRRAAVTNAPRANAELMLGAIGLAGAFEALVIGAECAQAKPHPEPYLQGLAALGMQPHQVIAVEDSPSGMQAATGAGIATVGITSGQPEERLLEAGAVHIIADFHQLLQLVPESARQLEPALRAAMPGEDGVGMSVKT